MESISIAKKALINTFSTKTFRSIGGYYLILVCLPIFLSIKSYWPAMTATLKGSNDTLFFGPSYYILSLVNFIFSFFFLVIVFQMLRSTEEKNEFRLPKLSVIISKVWRMFLVSIVSGFFITLGFLCCIIPGIFLCKRYIYVLNIAEQDMLGPLNSMRKSRALSEKNGWTTMGSLVILGIIFYAITLPIMFTSYPGFTTEPSFWNFTVGNILIGWFSYVAFYGVLFYGYRKVSILAVQEQ